MKHALTRRSAAGRSVSRTILVPLLILLILEVVFLLCGIHFTGVISRLDENAQRMLAQQVENRKNYLETEMLSNWAEMSALSDGVNAKADALRAAGELDLRALDEQSANRLLQDVTPLLIDAIYSKRVSGVFIVLNTQDLSSNVPGDGTFWPGVSIRDLDPLSPRSFHNSDLLFERAPIPVVQSLNLSTDAAWTPAYTFETQAQWGPFYWPFQAAYASGGALSAGKCTYWSQTPYVLPETDLPALSCSIPLIGTDRKVYGVLGVELLADYFGSKLPHSELMKDGLGTYFLVVDDGTACRPVLSTGPLAGAEPLEIDASQPSARFSLGGADQFAAISPLTLYGRNTLFSGQQWALVGMASESDLYAFSRSVSSLLGLLIFLVAVLSVAGGVAISRQLSAPIRKLAEQVDEAQKNRSGIPDLSLTGIREIDRFSAAITGLSRDVMESSTRFSRIIEMSSVDLAGFELRGDHRSVFITENFFSLFGLESPGADTLSREEFHSRLSQLSNCLTPLEPEADSWMYQIPRAGGFRYILVRVNHSGRDVVGVAEDVTASTLERLRIEHDRDYDLLTGLYNRRAFYRAVTELFQRPEALGCAALMMLDLDNLKRINDRFGHDFGDQYIRSAGLCLSAATPESTLRVRISGDEFYLFFYGYHEKEEIRRKITAVLEAARSEFIVLPNGKKQFLSFSGGVAWYPDDSRDSQQLMKYADSAMYQVKHGQKNDVNEFDLRLYTRQSSFTQQRREFQHLLSQELLQFHFQPIVDARTGAVRAYEELMRADLPTLKNPEQILSIAREEGRLAEIERLTWFLSARAYRRLLERGAVDGGALLFINSIASQHMTPEDSQRFHEEFSDLQPRIVAELTEADSLDAAAMACKLESPGFSGMLALDDYGSGYNGEKNLLELSPNFIKVDLSIIRDIDRSRDKRQLVSNLVSYAHQRDMLVLAEGVETGRELETVLSLGVDLLQGYKLARPGAEPPPVDAGALEAIQAFWREHPGGDGGA